MGLNKRERQYLEMSHNELKALSDDELFYAVMIRTEQKVGEYEDWAEGVNSLNPYQKIFYSVNWLEVEVNNGGLSQFFINSSRMVAPLVSEYMAIIGAEEHKRLYDGFLEKYKIDSADIASFASNNWEEVEERYERYPFDEYDDAFYDMKPLETYLTKYARENLTEF